MKKLTKLLCAAALGGGLAQPANAQGFWPWSQPAPQRVENTLTCTFTNTATGMPIAPRGAHPPLRNQSWAHGRRGDKEARDYARGAMRALGGVPVRYSCMESGTGIHFTGVVNRWN